VLLPGCGDPARLGDICDMVSIADFHGGGFSAFFKESVKTSALHQKHHS
jgi:hypothetical protein